MLSLISFPLSLSSPKLVNHPHTTTTFPSKPSSPPPMLKLRASSACAAADLARPPTSSSFYDVLGISAGASNIEIKAAYRRLARSCHPDVARGNHTSSDEFIKVRSAYSTLSDPDKRADYDRKLFIRSAAVRSRYSGISSSISMSSAYCSMPRRNWESDQCW